MDGSSRAGFTPAAGGAWLATGQPAPTAAGQGGGAPAGTAGGGQGHPGLCSRASRDTASGPRVPLGEAVAAATSAPGWWRATRLFASEPSPRPAAPLDIALLNDSAQDGRLARSILQVALDRPGQTIELDLSLAFPGATPGNPAAARTDRTLSLRFQPSSGLSVSTSAPWGGSVSFGSRDLSILSGEADTAAGLLDRVGSLSVGTRYAGTQPPGGGPGPAGPRFTVVRVRTDPPAVVTGLPGPSQDGSLTAQEQSLVGVARWPDRAHNREDEPRQQAYGRSFWSVTRDAGSQLAQGRIRSLRELWTYAQDWRGSMVPAGDRSDFGLGSQRREHGVASSDMTPLVGPYAYISNRCKQRSDGVPAYPERHSKRYSIRDAIDEKPIALTSVTIRTQWDEASAIQYGQACRRGEHWPPGGPPPLRINHTSVANAQRIMDHAESLFSRVLNPLIPQADALATLGELHWWLSHAMPDTRGSAAKAELCVRSLAQARGMDLPPFKPGFVPDLEAMIRPRTEYVAGYASAFSRPPDV